MRLLLKSQIKRFGTQSEKRKVLAHGRLQLEDGLVARRAQVEDPVVQANVLVDARQLRVGLELGIGLGLDSIIMKL